MMKTNGGKQNRIFIMDGKLQPQQRQQQQQPEQKINVE